MRFLSILILFAICNRAHAQQGSDTAAVKVSKSAYSAARKASILSAVIPGAGQVYNRKYWKVPIIYAGMGAFGYIFYTNNGNYNDYRRALRESDTNGKGTAVVQGQTYTTSNLQKQKIYYRQQRDIGVMGMAAFYLLNIIDANVDAHLKTFDVSDDLSLRIKPDYKYIGTSGAACLSFQLNFK